MFRIGEIQALQIVKKVEFGIYLAEKEKPEEKVLLPVKQVPADAKMGDEIEVFLYRDSSDRLIATTNRPKLTLHELAILRVAQVSQIGAFLDWGLEKDLFLPYKEQTRRVQEGDMCLVALYVDKSGRLCATMKVYEYLEADSPYKRDDRVEGLVYEMSRDLGAFVAVDNRYSGRIAPKELYGALSVGDVVSARVTGVKEDGKLDLSLREKAYLQMDVDADTIMQRIEKNGGKLPFTDKASPELIRQEMQMSKNEFKRAVGRLLKAGKIRIDENEIVKTL